jgi:transcription elongation factor GreB
MVTLENDAGDELQYRIVGADEIDPARGYISVDSPVARALLGRSVDDEVVVELPEGPASLVILQVDY